jgi:hypothetical protein
VSELKLIGDVKAKRSPTITSAFWAIREVMLEQKAATVSELLASYRMNEPDKNRERITAKLVVLETLEDVFRSHLPPDERSFR